MKLFILVFIIPSFYFTIIAAVYLAAIFTYSEIMVHHKMQNTNRKDAVPVNEEVVSRSLEIKLAGGYRQAGTSMK